MEQILADIKGIIVYQDDVLIFAENDESLTKRVNAVKTRLAEKRVTINEKKSIEYSNEISFLGFRISARGIEPDDKLVEKIRYCHPPTNRQEVEYFVGLMNYFGRLIPRFSDKIAPINALRNQKTTFVWTKQCTTAFESLKREISRAPVVQPYSLEKEATLTTDASQEAVAAVLTQEGHPVIYVSRRLSNAESKYSNVEREALAIVWSITRLKHLLLGRKFTINTDHKPLEYLYGENNAIPSATSARISRWALMLMQYDYTISYVKGKKYHMLTPFRA